MTKEQILDLTEFTIKNHNSDDDALCIFNLWSIKKNVNLTNYDEAMWAIGYIKDIKNTDISIISEAQKIDKNSKGEYYGKK